MEQWNGTTAIITGASSGIGAAIAKRFVENGINVVGIARRMELLEELAETLSTDTVKFYPRQCDVTQENEILDIFAWVESEIGPVSILVNNAGIFNGSTNISEGDSAVLKKTISTNCIALCIFTREAIKAMKAHGIDGLIIQMSSISGRYIPNLPGEAYRANIYPPSKRALTALAQVLRTELRQEKSKIRVSLLSPGITITEIFKDHLKEDLDAFSDMPYMVPDDIAQAALYILSTPPSVEVDELIVRPLGEYI